MTYRKRRRPTPNFKIPPPYNPLHGEQANLRQDGISPFCVIMQVAAEDIYDEYVICRGFDSRILRFIDYAEGDVNKPGISVAKPFGKRIPNIYRIAEVYPALLPTQGNPGFVDFRQVVFTPPSPVGVNWRVGQNPGVVVDGQNGGQPEELTDTIQILRDHNNKVVNWLLLDSSQLGDIEYTIQSAAEETSGPYTGLMKAAVKVQCGPAGLIGKTVEVIDHSRCLFDEPDMAGYTGWAYWTQSWSLDENDPCETLTPMHWAAKNRCCAPDSGLYAEGCT